MFRKSHIAASAGIFLALIPASSPAAEITIEGKRGWDIGLVPLSGSAGPRASSILRSDLTRAGWFRLVPPGGGRHVVSGATTGRKVKGKLVGPKGEAIFHRSYDGPDLKMNAHRFSDDIVRAITGRPGISASQVVFVGGRSGRKELFLCNVDGSNVRQLTHDNSISVSPGISHDGTRVAYTSYRSGWADVYLIDLRSGDRRRIVKHPGTNTGAAFSPDGRRIALSMSFSGNPELYTMGVGSSRPSRLTRTSGAEGSPTWSPNGNQIAYVSNTSGSPQIYIISASGGRGKKLSLGYNYCTEPDWSPDGAKIAFNARTGGRFVIASHDLKTRRTRVVSRGGNAENPAWGADSRHIVFVRGGAIFMVDTFTGATTRVHGGGAATEVSWTR